MTQEGVAKLVNKLIKNYPSTYGNYGRSDMEAMIETWAMALEDFEDEAVTAAFKTFLINDQKGFPPAIGQIVALIPVNGNVYNTVLTPGEAWTLVLNAMKNVTYQPRESFDRLPEIVQRILGGVEALQELGGTDAKAREIEKQRFFRAYDDAIAEAKRNGKALPTRGEQQEIEYANGSPRPGEVRREAYYFPGAVEVANPRTGVIMYVQYAGYPYGDGDVSEHGGLNGEKLTAWHIKTGGGKKKKKEGEDNDRD